MDFEMCIGIVLFNCDIIYSLFCFYVVFVVVFQGYGFGFVEIYVEGLKVEVFGVKGKFLGEGLFCENLCELECLDLIEMMGCKWFKYWIYVRLKELDGGCQVFVEFWMVVVVFLDVVWGLDFWCFF